MTMNAIDLLIHLPTSNTHDSFHSPAVNNVHRISTGSSSALQQTEGKEEK